jgi:hypothetical protein
MLLLEFPKRGVGQLGATQILAEPPPPQGQQRSEKTIQQNGSSKSALASVAVMLQPEGSLTVLEGEASVTDIGNLQWEKLEPIHAKWSEIDGVRLLVSEAWRSSPVDTQALQGGPLAQSRQGWKLQPGQTADLGLYFQVPQEMATYGFLFWNDVQLSNDFIVYAGPVPK